MVQKIPPGGGGFALLAISLLTTIAAEGLKNALSEMKTMTAPSYNEVFKLSKKLVPYHNHRKEWSYLMADADIHPDS